MTTKIVQHNDDFQHAAPVQQAPTNHPQSLPPLICDENCCVHTMPLLVAAASGDYDTLDDVLYQGCHKTRADFDCNMRGPNGLTATHYVARACTPCAVDMLDSLLERGALIDNQDDSKL